MMEEPPGGSNKSDCNSSKQWANYIYDEDYLLEPPWGFRQHSEVMSK
jgi:hypothetical protein